MGIVITYYYHDHLLISLDFVVDGDGTELSPTLQHFTGFPFPDFPGHRLYQPASCGGWLSLGRSRLCGDPATRNGSGLGLQLTRRRPWAATLRRVTRQTSNLPTSVNYTVFFVFERGNGSGKYGFLRLEQF